MKYLYEKSTESKMSYLDKHTFMNHVMHFAKKDLNLESDSTPFMLELNMISYGSTVSYLLSDNTELLGYVKISSSQQLYEMINTILHETKHIQQIIDNPLYYRISHKIKLFLTKRHLYGGLFYFFSPHEISARRYARKAMKKYYKELNALIEKAYNNELGELLY